MGIVYYIDEQCEIQSARAVASLDERTRRREARALLGREDASSEELWAAMREVSAVPEQPALGKSRLEPHSPRHVIRLLCSTNPKARGTKAHQRWELYRDGMQVGEYLAAGGRRADLRWDTDKGFIRVDAPLALP